MRREHDIAERETACVDGYCPLCLESLLAKERDERDEVVIAMGQSIEILKMQHRRFESKAERLAECLKKVQKSYEDKINSLSNWDRAEAMAEINEALSEYQASLSKVEGKETTK